MFLDPASPRGGVGAEGLACEGGEAVANGADDDEVGVVEGGDEDIDDT